MVRQQIENLNLRSFQKLSSTIWKPQVSELKLCQPFVESNHIHVWQFTNLTDTYKVSEPYFTSVMVLYARLKSGFSGRRLLWETASTIAFTSLPKYVQSFKNLLTKVTWSPLHSILTTFWGWIFCKNGIFQSITPQLMIVWPWLFNSCSFLCMSHFYLLTCSNPLKTFLKVMEDVLM